MKSKKAIITAVAVVAVLAAVITVAVMLMGKKETYRVLKVQSFDGNVTYERDSKTEDIIKEMNLISDDRVITGADSNLELLADSDKHIVAEENTCFSVRMTGDEGSGKITIKMEYGTALYTIDHKLEDGQKFEVHTPNATLSVRGTTFRVSYDPDTNTTRVDVIEGTVEVQTEDEEIELNEEESVLVTDDEIQPPMPTADMDAALEDGGNTADETGGLREDDVTDDEPDSGTQDPEAEYLQAICEYIDSMEAGTTVFFGTYEQDNDLSNGAEYIEWRILDKNDGAATLLSVNVLDAMPYDTGDRAVTWEICNLRAWLNNEFYNTAFSSQEQQMILDTYLVNNDNPVYGTPGGNDTVDKVFCLSMEDAGYWTGPNNTSYDLVEGYYSDDPYLLRFYEVTPYAQSKGLEERIAWDEAIEWWLRSPGGLPDDWGALVQYYNTTCLDGANSVLPGGECVDQIWGVRPVIRISY